MAKIKTPPPKPRMYADYTQNCGKCKKCTIPGWLESRPPIKCPKCLSTDKFRLRIGNNPCDNWVMCNNCNHSFDVREQMDEADIELHQKTIRQLQGVRE